MISKRFWIPRSTKRLKMKYLRILLYIIVGLILLVLIAAPIYLNYWRNNATENTFTSLDEASGMSFADIKWRDDSLGQEKVEKIALFLPVKVKGITGNLFMQFDSGAQKTHFYGKTINQLMGNGKKIKTSYNADSLLYYENPELTIGNSKLNTDKLRIVSSRGNEEIDSTFINIGTIGFDAFVDRTLILDFKQDRVAITETLVTDLDYNLEFVEKASVDRFPFLIPAKINGKKSRLYYDTGSSMFSLLTSNKKLLAIESGVTDTLCCVRNWERLVPVHRKKLETPIQMGGFTFENDAVYGCEVLDMVNYFPNWFIFGITGNKMFDDAIVVIDTQNNKFGIEK